MVPSKGDRTSLLRAAALLEQAKTIVTAQAERPAAKPLLADDAPILAGPADIDGLAGRYNSGSNVGAGQKQRWEAQAGPGNPEAWREVLRCVGARGAWTMQSLR